MIDQTISHYKILEKLCEGSMGIAYNAEDTKSKRKIALNYLQMKCNRAMYISNPR